MSTRSIAWLIAWLWLVAPAAAQDLPLVDGAAANKPVKRWVILPPTIATELRKLDPASVVATLRLSLERAQAFYAVHKDRPFYDDLVAYMTSGPVMIQVLEGENAVNTNRDIMGATNPADAAPGTIRADFAASIEENVVHGSDGPETAAQEISFFFGANELCPRTRG